MDSNAATKWFYSVGDERKGPFSEAQISALLSAGVLNEHSKVWSEATAEWTPLFRTELRTLLGERDITPPEIAPPVAEKTAPPPASSPRSTSASPSYPTYDNNRTLGDAVFWALCALGMVELFSVAWIFKGAGLEDKIYRVRFLESEQTLAVLAIPTGIAAILFLTWKYRATANAFNIAGSQSITPRGAVYWYFVPVAFFWKPFEAMRNLHDSFIGTRAYRPLYEWWAAWLGSLAVPIVGYAIHGDTTIDTTNSAGNYIFWRILSHVASGVSFYCAAKLIRELGRAEAAKAGAA